MPAFTPTAYLLSFGCLIGCATLSWATILRYDLGLRPAFASTASSTCASSTATAASAASAATASCASSSAAKPKYPPPPPPPPSGETSPLLTTAPPQTAPLTARGAAWRTAPVCLVAWPVAAVTWGLGPSLLQFATAHAACSCDPTEELARHTYSYAVSLSFILMPCAGLASYALPAFRLPTLAALAATHLCFYSVLVVAATGTAALRCSANARALVILCVAATCALV